MNCSPSYVRLWGFCCLGTPQLLRRAEGRCGKTLNPPTSRYGRLSAVAKLLLAESRGKRVPRLVSRKRQNGDAADALAEIDHRELPTGSISYANAGEMPSSSAASSSEVGYEAHHALNSHAWLPGNSFFQFF